MTLVVVLLRAFGVIALENWMTWHADADFRNWIDDPNEVQGKEHIEDYFAILPTDPGWRENLDRAEVQLICIQSNAPLTYRLSESADWRERYRDEWAVIFERVQARETLRRTPFTSHSASSFSSWPCALNPAAVLAQFSGESIKHKNSYRTLS